MPCREALVERGDRLSMIFGIVWHVFLIAKFDLEGKTSWRKLRSKLKSMQFTWFILVPSPQVLTKNMATAARLQ